MRNFVGYTENENFKVGCTGQTTYVYDKDGNELARFKKDILYGYRPMFQPNSNIVVVKSTEGRLAIYNLDKLTLVKKVRTVPTPLASAQDGNMCFSKDGKLFYNIESHIGCRTRLTIYDTDTFEPIKRLFENDEKQMLIHIECDRENGNIYLLGYMRDDEGIYHQPFVAQLENDEIINKTNISHNEYKYLNGYKHLEGYGFTKEVKEWSALSRHYGYDLTDIEKKNIRLADYIK
ncbi:MAG: hypothetical protein IKU66_06305 [Clostridia bacterium]|nr:hypothetical protein [Clostridia bacterium]